MIKRLRLLRRTLVSTTLTISMASAFALTVEISEHKGDQLRMEVHVGDTSEDRAIAVEFAAQKFAVDTLNPDTYLVSLDSTVQVAHYLRAAKLSGGVYVFFPALCPASDCSKIKFIVKAQRILFGHHEATDSFDVDSPEGDATAIFFTNEKDPRLNDGLYVDPSLSAESAKQIQENVLNIRREYAGIAHRDVLANFGVIATIARNNGGYTGFGGDSLNIIRMTFDNPSGVSETQMVQAFASTYAHEAAHKLQSPRLFNLPQGRLVTEGSADFFKVVVLRRSHTKGEGTTTELVTDAYDACVAKRADQGLLERITSHQADHREHYDCGMINYFGLMFSLGDSDEDFLDKLQAALGGDAKALDSTTNCLLLSATCSDPAVKDMMGDLAHLQARRQWFMAKLNDYLSIPQSAQNAKAAKPN